jgi:hypothetical protein
MKRQLLSTFAAAAAMVVLCSSANAWTFNDPLTGAQETPPNASPATGTASGTYNEVTNVLTIMVMASGFVANLTAGHIHRGAVGVAGPIIIPLANTAGGTTWHSHQQFTLTAAQEADLMNGLHYVNLHTTVFPGGEIRGQLHLVPEPASMLALAIGSAGTATPPLCGAVLLNCRWRDECRLIDVFTIKDQTVALQHDPGLILPREGSACC